jgi:hypothetical protein
MTTRSKHRDLIAITVAAVSFAISIASFGLSAITTYYSVLRVQEDVRVVMWEFPSVLLDAAEKKLKVSRSLSFLFINAGSRTISINNIYLNIAQPSKGNPLSEKGCHGDGVSVEFYESEPFVVKPGEMETRKTQLIAPTRKANGHFDDATLEEQPFVLIPLSADNQGKKKVKYKACVLVDLTTLDADYNGLVAEELADEIDESTLGYTFYSSGEVRPLQLIKKSRIILFN